MQKLLKKMYGILFWSFVMLYTIFIIILIILNYIHNKYTKTISLEKFNKIRDGRYYNYVPSICIICKVHMGYNYNPLLKNITFVCEKCKNNDYDYMSN